MIRIGRYAGYGYRITNENYYPDLERVRESKAILTTVKV
jgi:hypothetical protein